MNIAAKIKALSVAPFRSGCMNNNQLKYAHMDAPQILPTALPLLNMHGQRGTLMNTDLLFRSIDGSGVPNKRKCERLMAAAACDALSSPNGKKLNKVVGHGGGCQDVHFCRLYKLYGQGHKLNICAIRTLFTSKRHHAWVSLIFHSGYMRV